MSRIAGLIPPPMSRHQRQKPRSLGARGKANAAPRSVRAFMIRLLAPSNFLVSQRDSPVLTCAIAPASMSRRSESLSGSEIAHSCRYSRKSTSVGVLPHRGHWKWNAHNSRSWPVILGGILMGHWTGLRGIIGNSPSFPSSREEPAFATQIPEASASGLSRQEPQEPPLRSRSIATRENASHLRSAMTDSLRSRGHMMGCAFPGSMPM